MGESKLLKVTGIIMIIGGGLSLLLGFLGLAGGAATAAMYDENMGSLLMALSVITLIAAAIQLVAGILGAKNWKTPEKAQSCFIMGIIVILLSIASNLISISMSGFNTSGIVSILIGLILPVLYTYGAMQLKKSA